MSAESDQALTPDESDAPKSESVQITRTVKAAAFSGPLPPPSLLKGYEDVLPGSAERIIKMAEGQSAHRQAMESRALGIAEKDAASESSRSKWGLIAGTVVVLTVAALAFASIIAGHPWPGGIVLVTNLVVVLSAYFFGVRIQRNTPVQMDVNHTPSENGEALE